MSDETRGVPLVCTYAAQRLGVYEFLTVHDDTVPTHTAYPVAEARLLEAVAEAVGTFTDVVARGPVADIYETAESVRRASRALASHRKEQS